MRSTLSLSFAALALFLPLNPGAQTQAFAEGPHGPSTPPAVRVGTLEVGEPILLPPIESSRSGATPRWVVQLPGPETQQQTSVKERGANPCMMPDPGFGNYTGWDRAPSMGQMILPKDLELGADGEFDVFFHFHGHDPARKAWVQAMEHAVLVGVDLGIGSGAYLSKFGNREEFRALLASVEAGVAQRLGVDQARAGRIGLSSWSAGYGAVGQVLRDAAMADRVDSVVLLDGLHTSIDGNGLEQTKLQAFVDFAERAADGEKLMFVSHSSIIPPDYASTTQTASFLIWKTGGEPQAAKRRSGDPTGLDLISRYSYSGFHVRGYSGNDTLDHCAHLSLFKDVLRSHVIPRWNP